MNNKDWAIDMVEDAYMEGIITAIQEGSLKLFIKKREDKKLNDHKGGMIIKPYGRSY